MFGEKRRLREQVAGLEGLLADERQHNERLRKAIAAQNTVLAEQRQRIADLEVLRAGMLRTFEQVREAVGNVPLGIEQVGP